MPTKRNKGRREPVAKTVQALLQKYECPVPYHAVRTRFLGTIVSPIVGVTPIATLKGLWGGEFPAFDNLNALNELMQVLIMGLWNQLTLHQKVGQPFRFIELSVPQTLEGLATLALVRREEIDGFIDGLFGPAERIDLPESGYRALGEIGEIRAMLAGIYELATRPAEKGGDDVANLIDNVQQISTIAEHELYQTVLACVRARNQLSHALPVTKPVFH
jgi:hypothetical protein